MDDGGGELLVVVWDEVGDVADCGDLLLREWLAPQPALTTASDEARVVTMTASPLRGRRRPRGLARGCREGVMGRQPAIDPGGCHQAAGAVAHTQAGVEALLIRTPGGTPSALGGGDATSAGEPLRAFDEPMTNRLLEPTILSGHARTHP